MAQSGEAIYECEVEILFKRDGEKYKRWVLRPLADAILTEGTRFRCKDCHGAVRLHGKKAEHGPAPHFEHKLRDDSEYCPAGIYFQKNPGRIPRKSENPVV